MDVVVQQRKGLIVEANQFTPTHLVAMLARIQYIDGERKTTNENTSTPPKHLKSFTD